MTKTILLQTMSLYEPKGLLWKWNQPSKAARTVVAIPKYWKLNDLQSIASNLLSTKMDYLIYFCQIKF